MAVKTVEEYIAKHSKWENELKQLRKLLLDAKLDETIKWGGPTYTWDGKNVIGIGAFKNHYGLWFFNGSFLQKNTKLLVNAQEGKTKALRQIRLEKGDPLNLNELKKYVEEAIECQKAGKELKPKRNTKPIEIPVEMKEAFENNLAFEQAFHKLTPGKQREYCEHIASAKREETKISRLEKIIPMIIDGKGLHDKYKNC